jgi:hypothetical protein
LRIGGMAGMDPLMSAVDAVLVRVPTVETGLAFYMDRLGHELIWRTSEAADWPWEAPRRSSSFPHATGRKPICWLIRLKLPWSDSRAPAVDS